MSYAQAITQAARRTAPHVRRTPILRAWDGLGVKAESLQPTGSFKIRGAFNSLLALTPEQRARGVIAHSSGNHAQAVAWAARELGIRALLVMPVDAPRPKIEGVQRCGGEVLVVGPSSAERSERARELAARHGYVAIEPYDSEAVIAATGVIGLEILADAPETAAVYAPVGGGGLMAGLAVALKQHKPSVRVIGVEPEVAADLVASRRAGQIVALPAEQMALTAADGLRVQQVGRRNWPLLRDHVDEVVTVSEIQIAAAMMRLAVETRLVAEPSGAVAAAGAWASGADPGRSVAVLSGGNVDLTAFGHLLRVTETPSRSTSHADH